MGNLHLGIDGGAGTIKWAAQRGVETPHLGRSQGGNLSQLGWERFLERLAAAVGEALAALGGAPADVATIGLGLSGIDRPNEARILREWADGYFQNLESIWVGNDALPGLRQGAGRLEGIVLVGGTGSIAYGVTPNGTLIRVGGWGQMLGDEGSGYWIGQQALFLATRMADHVRPAGPLLAAVLKELEVPEPMALIPWAAALDRDAFKRRVSRLTPLVFSLAKSGDRDALALVTLAERHLGGLIRTLARRMREADESIQGSIQCICTGSTFDDDWFLGRLSTKLTAAGTAPVRLSEAPSLGSLALGIEARHGALPQV